MNKDANKDARERNQRTAGFTLLEILVALTVMGFLLVTLSHGTRFGMRAWNTQTRAIDAQEELEAVDRTLRHLVAEIDTGTTADAIPLMGEASRLAFVSRLPMAAPGPQGTGRGDGQTGGHFAAIVLRVDASHRLEMLWRPYTRAVLFGPPPASRGDILLTGVERLEMSYWRREGGWSKSWSDRELPALIRFRLVFPSGDPRRWPDVVVTPMRGRREG